MDGIHSATTSRACRTGRCTARENSAISPAGVAEIDSVPSTRQATATPNAHRRRHHNKTQAKVTLATSTTIRVVDNGTTSPCRAGLKKSASSAAAVKQPAASTTRPRPVCGPVELGRVGSLDPGSDAGLTSLTHNRDDGDKAPA